MSDDPEIEYGLLYPFIVCQSHDGPYDDQAFVAGAQFGRIAARLELAKPSYHQEYVASSLVPQLDLLAMHEGYTMATEPWVEHPTDWTLVTLRRSA